MTFELEFDPRAWKEWNKLGATVRQQFKKKLAKVLEQPSSIPSSKPELARVLR